MDKINNSALLERFMKEHFPYAEFKKAGLFTKEMRGDYEAQAQWVCSRLGLKSIYEYGKDEIVCHLSYEEGARPTWINEEGKLKTEPFITVIPSIYE